VNLTLSLLFLSKKVILVTTMSQKSIIMFGMIVGSFAGGYLSTVLGADSLSFTSLLGSGVGGLIGIWIAYRLTR